MYCRVFLTYTNMSTLPGSSCYMVIQVAEVLCCSMWTACQVAY